MATTSKIQCAICAKEKTTYRCGGCSNEFCFHHLTEHRQSIEKQLDEIEYDHDLFRQTIFEQKTSPEKHSLIDQINQWEKQSIEQIQQTAQQCREKLIDSRKNSIAEFESKLNDLGQQLKELRAENELNEMYICQYKENLNGLKEEFDKPSNISIEKQSTSFIDKIMIIQSFEKSYSHSRKRFHLDNKWKQVGIAVAGGHGQGNQLNQFSRPCGICLSDDQTIYVADYDNNRIVEWKLNATNGRILAGRNGKGNGIKQLNGPTDVIFDHENDSLIIADQENRRVIRVSCRNPINEQILISDIDCWRLTMDKNGSLYVSDWKKNEVRKWRKGDGKGVIVAGGNGQGNQLNQLDYPNFIFVDDDGSVYISERDNHRVIKWTKDAKEGIVVAGGNGQGNSLKQLSRPQGLFLDHSGQIYVVDYQNDRVVCWNKGALEGSIVVGGHGKGQQSNQLHGPIGLVFDRQGNMYIADCRNHRVQKFEID